MGTSSLGAEEHSEQDFELGESRTGSCGRGTDTAIDGNDQCNSCTRTLISHRLDRSRPFGTLQLFPSDFFQVSVHSEIASENRRI